MKAIVFDLDDTLYPERTYAYSGFAAVAESFEDVLGDPAISTKTMRGLFDSTHRAHVFNEMLRRKNLSGEAQLLADMIDTFRRHQPAISLYADAEAALTRLEHSPFSCSGTTLSSPLDKGGKRGVERCTETDFAMKKKYRLGIITDGPTVQQSAKVTALRLESRVHEIILTDELGRGFDKPHPRSFELMAERLGVEHDACVYVADNPAKDFVAPCALGWQTIRIVRPDGIYRDTPIADGGTPHHTIESLDALDALL